MKYWEAEVEDTRTTPAAGPGILTPELKANIWKAGDPSPNPSGRPKGAKNRATIVREILELMHASGQTYEYAGTKAVADKMLSGDVGAWDKLMDSAYGKIADQMNLDHTTKGKPITAASSRLGDFLSRKKPDVE